MDLALAVQVTKAQEKEPSAPQLLTEIHSALLALVEGQRRQEELLGQLLEYAQSQTPRGRFERDLAAAKSKKAKKGKKGGAPDEVQGPADSTLDGGERSEVSDSPMESD